MPARNSEKECHGDYDKVVWLSPLLRHRVIVCKDDFQYIYMIKDGKDDWRGASFHTDWGSLHRRYPDLELMGCPLHSPNMLSNERRKLRGAVLKKKASGCSLRGAGRPRRFQCRCRPMPSYMNGPDCLQRGGIEHCQHRPTTQPDTCYHL